MLSLRKRIAVGGLVASAVALLVVLFAVVPPLRVRATEEMSDLLLAEARLAARVVEDELDRGTTPDRLDPVVDAAARDVRARVTVIAPDGRVLADSAFSGAELLALENYRNRPEVEAALA